MENPENIGCGFGTEVVEDLLENAECLASEIYFIHESIPIGVNCDNLVIISMRH